MLSSRRVRLGLALLIVAALAAGTAVLLSRRSSVSAQTTVVVGADTAARLPDGYVGLSIESKALALNLFATHDYAPVLAPLGPHGTLRIGGTSGDSTFWTSRHETPPSWTRGVITPADLAGLAALLKATGWHAVVTVNLRHFDPARAADMARHTAQILGPSLTAMEIGNEPNYYVSPAAFVTEFDAYVQAMRAAVPGLPIVGPDAAHKAYSFLAAVAAPLARDHLLEATLHHYPTEGCQGATADVSQFFGSAFVANENRAAANLVRAAGVMGAVPVMSETNSANCGGIPGFSDTAGSALWALQYGLLLARDGVQRVNFHTGQTTACSGYTVVCLGASGALTVRPDYDGLVALARVGSGVIEDVATRGDPAVWSFAVRTAAGRSVVLLDTGSAPLVVRVELGATFHAVSSTTLSGSSLSARTADLGGAQFGGASPRAPRSRPCGADTSSVTVRLDPASAQVIAAA